MERETFYDAQARHRRAAVGWSVMCGIAAMLLAVAASFVLTPFVLVSGALLSRLIHVVAPLPPSFWQVFQDLAATLADGQRAAFDGRLTSADVVSAARSLAILLLPGVLLVLALWRALRSILLRDGGAGVAQAFGVRAPRDADLEERQLVNVTEEMAIAAGLPRPQVCLVDYGEPNVAAIGSSPEHATIVITRSTLESLDREQTQAALGHIVGSIANGDLKLGLETLAVAQTFGFLATLLEAPLNASARKRLRLLRRAAKARGDADTNRAALVAGFCAGLDPDTIGESGSFLDDLDRPETRGFKSFVLHARAVFLLPLFGVVLVAKLFMLIATLLCVMPLVGSMLRHRKYLADATAIQLTRNADTLAEALAKLAGPAGGVGGHWAPHLFIVTPGGDAQGTETPLLLIAAQPPVSARLQRLRALGARITVPEEPGVKLPRPRFPRLPDVGPVLQLVTLAIAALILSPLVGFVAYLFGVTVLFAVGVAAGAYWLALWVVAQLIP